MTSVIFGATSSPSTAIYVKNRNATYFEERYPEAVKAIELNHYMDDYLHSFHEEETFKRITAQVDYIHKNAGFELRGWASNRPTLLEHLPQDTIDKTEIDLGEKEEKTLGLRWFTQKDDLITEAEKIGVRWKFIPPGAPNTGGAWERLVRSIKTALNATLKERYPREEVLYTLLLEAEHVVNSRPLTHLSDVPEEEALTPNHFLIGRSCGAARLGVIDDGVLVGRDTWKTTQRLADHFWKRWLREYLPTLLPRKIHDRTRSTDLKVGDIVLIVDHSLPRCTWPRGRIHQVYPGPDGRTRIVDVETKGGILRRPCSRIVLLVPRMSPCQKDGATHEGENVGDITVHQRSM